MNQPLYQELSVKVLGMAFRVHNILGPGLLEHCYQEAFCLELRRSNIPFDREKIYALYYMGECIGGYRADLVVDDKIILELKSVKELSHAMEAVAERTISNFYNKREINWRSRSPHPWDSATLSHPWLSQTINYLRLSKIPVGYLVNFNGERVVWKRLSIRRE